MQKIPDGKDTNVPSKTPEEIKKGLECCADGRLCLGYCPYGDNIFNRAGCTTELSIDALAYIEQLERKNKDLLEERELNDFLRDKVKKLEAQVHKWTSVAEHLPPTPGKYLVYSKVGTMYTSRFDPDIHKRWPHFGKVSVTHWMQRPEEPKENEA